MTATSASATRRIVHCMGTVFSFDVREPGVPGTVLDEATALLGQLDATFSTYREGSEISRLGRGELPVEACSAEVRFVLGECERYRLLTGGYFSAYAAGSLDPSGYVKGWAIERVSDLLRAAGSARHCVNGGGDVQCVGGTTATPWRIGIADPAPGRHDHHGGVGHRLRRRHVRNRAAWCTHRRSSYRCATVGPSQPHGRRPAPERGGRLRDRGVRHGTGCPRVGRRPARVPRLRRQRQRRHLVDVLAGP
jgi:ApbE family protein